ncbi:MAG: two-component regulator propeller domain-containing protein [Phocaeicola sp.]
MKRAIFSSILLLLIVSTTHASNYRFKHIEVKDGLSNNQINHLFRDKEGFMWFSTAFGLNRYDGAETINYLNYTSDKGVFSDNFLYDIQQDYDDNLWIRTKSGYTIYDPKIEAFNSEIRMWMMEKGIEGIPSKIYIDSTKRMWLYVPNKGVYLYIPDTKLLYGLFYSNNTMPQGEIATFSECREGVLLLFDDAKIICLSREDATIKWEEKSIPQRLGNVKHSNLHAFTDRDGEVWIHSSVGLWLYNPTLRKWQDQIIASLGGESVKTIQAITQDSEGKIWIGKAMGGIDILNKTNGTIENVTLEESSQNGLQSNAIESLYTDRNGTVWIGTSQRGVSLYNESDFKFEFDALGDISCMEKGKEETLWLGINGKGLAKWNRIENSLEFVKGYNWQTFPAKTITALLESKNGTLWIGTQEDGLLSYAKGEYTQHPNLSISQSINSLAEDQEGIIWIGIEGQGVQSYQPQNKESTIYNVNNAQILSNQVYSLCITRNNNLLIGTSRGISILNLDSKKVVNWIGAKSGRTALSHLQVTQLYEDSKGLIWMGTHEGLNVYHFSNDILKLVSIGTDKKEPTINGIIEDRMGSIWVTTSNGIATITTIPSEGDESSYKIDLYSQKDGLQKGIFNPRSIEMLHSGELLFGGCYGMNSIIPERIKYNRIYPNILFTKLRIFNQEVKVGEKYNEQIVLEESLNRQREIRLKPTQNMIEIEFSSDDYISPEYVTYSYQLEGFNTEWFTTNQGKVTFTNLSPGEYKLRVKSINSDGFSSGEEAILIIQVLTDSWIVMGKLLLYGILILVLFIGARKVLKRRIDVASKNSINEKVLAAEEEAYSEEDRAKNNTTQSESSLNHNQASEQKERLLTQTEVIKESSNEEERSSSHEEINPAIFTIERVRNLFKNEREKVEEATECLSSLHVIQVIPLDREGKESLELIETAVKKTIEYDEKQEETNDTGITAQEFILAKNTVDTETTAHLPIILAVDDHDDMLSFIHETLHTDFQVEMATNGYEAWKLLENSTPDLIISDLEMPEIDGNELCHLVRSKEELASTPFLLLTSRKHNTFRDGEIAEGVNELLIKPFSTDNLIEVVNKLLSKESATTTLTRKKKVQSPSSMLADEKIVKDAINYIENNIGNSNLSIEELGKALKMDRVTLYKKISDTTGKTPVEFIRLVRLKRAAQLLRETPLNIANIAQQIGFSNQRNFEKYFEKEFGTSPTIYQKEQGEL